jgi:hypothetical protein
MGHMHFPLHHGIVELFENEVHHINLLKFLVPLAIVKYFKGMGEEIHKAATESIIFHGTR